MAIQTYIHIMADTLKKKNDILEQIIRITLLQEEYISATPPDMEKFEQTLAEKDILIEQINQLDNGFETVFERTRDEVINHKERYKEEILALQELIRQVTELSAKLQATELRNRSKLEVYFAGKKKEIKNFKVSSQTAASYYKSQSQFQGDAIFLDKKK